MTDNTMIIIFGGTGDLAKRKIIPAIYNLLEKKLLAPSTSIVCLGRKAYDKAQFIEQLELDRFIQGYNSESLERLVSSIVYLQVDLDSTPLGDFEDKIDEIAGANNNPENMLFYFALPAPIFGKAANLIKPFMDKDGWQRVVFEKPFGYDLGSATALNESIVEVLSEDQIYRVDHYLGKELVQNILTLRFRNELFKWAWHKDAIDHVQITVSERLGVEERAGYYDKSGAVRDMIQNHLLQLLSLVAMEPPRDDSSEAMRDSSANVLRAIKKMSGDDVVLGQYGTSPVETTWSGYRNEPGVADGSLTETFAAIRVNIDTERWQGIPFYLKTGKRLDERYADIKVVFKHNREFCAKGDCDQPNMIIIRIQPDDGIAILFNVKQPGASISTEPVLMDFCHHCHFGPNTPEAYESILYNVLAGDSSSFPRWDWLEASWRVVDQLKMVASDPVTYPSGSTGPEGSDQMLQNDGRHWIHGEVSSNRKGQVLFSFDEVKL